MRSSKSQSIRNDGPSGAVITKEQRLQRNGATRPKIFRPLLRHRHVDHFKRNQILFRCGDPVEGVYWLTSGKVKVIKGDPQKQSHILYFLQSGDFLGLPATTDQYYANSAVAVEKTGAIFIPLSEFIANFSRNSALRFTILGLMCQHIKDTEKRLLWFSRKNIRERFANILLDLQNKFGLDQQQVLNISLSRKELASFAGTTSETMSRIAYEFHRRKLIGLNKKRVKLLDCEELQKIAGPRSS